MVNRELDVLGWSDKLGVYKLIDLPEGEASSSPESYQVKFELERGGNENVLRFSLISRHLRWLQGEILTILEASIDGQSKLKATKDLVRKSISSKISWLYEQCGCPESEQDYLGENLKSIQNPDPTFPATTIEE